MVKAIPLGHGRYTFVDDADYDLVSPYKWFAVRNRPTSMVLYASGYVSPKNTVYLHRLILGVPKGVLVDHRDRDGLNNTRDNLRPATHRENAINSRYRPSKSGFRGVYKEPKGLFRAEVWNYGVRHRLGRYSDPAAAARVYDAKALELHGDFATLNFPKGTAA